MRDSTTSKTAVISSWLLLRFFFAAPLTGFVYVFYAGGYYTLRKPVNAARGMAKLNPLRLLILSVFYAYGGLFFLLNTAHNWLLMSWYLLEFPQEFQTTTRCKRWKIQDDDPSRQEFADMLGGFLDGPDPGHY